MTEIGNFVVAHWETILGVLLLLLATDGIAGYLPDKWVPYVGAVKRIAQILLTRFGKGVPIILAVLLLGGCAGLKMEETAAPMAIPPPPLITSAQVASPSGDTSRVTVHPDAIYDIAVAVAGVGAVEVESDVYGSGWNTDDTHAPSQNVVYDYLHLIDTDDDGDVDTIDATVWATKQDYDADIPDVTAFAGTLLDDDNATEALSTLGAQASMTAASQAEMEAGTEAAIRSMSPLRVAQAIAALAAGGPGDVTGVGDCSGGACLDGTSDGGTNIALYDGNSHKTTIAAGDSTGDLTYTLPTAAPAGNDALVVMATTGAMSTLPATTYQPLDASLSEIAGLTLAQGDILYVGASGVVYNLGAGTDGYFLKTQGAAANPVWAAPPGGGDITAVGNCANGDCFVDGGVGTSLTFEVTDNAYETILTAAEPGADATVTIPNTTGTIMLGPSGLGTDNVLVRTDGTGNLVQATGISVADTTNDVSGAGSYAAGTDPADAGAIRLENAASIMFEAAPAGTDVSALTVTSGEVVQIGASGASGVTVTPAATFSAGIANAGTVSAGTWQGTAVANAYVADDITLTNITQVTNRSLDDITDGTNYQRVAAADVDASGHLNRVYDSDGTGYATITGLSTARAITLVDAAQTLANLGSDQTFTGSLTFGNADTDTLTVQSVIRGGNSHAVWIDDDTTVAPTYATATNELFVEGDVESGGAMYATSFQSTGTGDSYISLANNAGGLSPGVGAYQIWFETDSSDQLKYSVNGSEKSAVNREDAQTISGAKTLSSALTINRGATGAGQLIIAEDSDDGSNTVTITAQAMAGSYTLTLPTTDGDASQYLQTNGSGSLSWASPTAAAAGSDTQVQFNDGGSALGGDAGFVFNKTTDTLTLGEASVDGVIVLYNELGATDYNATIQTNAAQAAAATITLPAATGTLAVLGANTFTGNQTAPTFVGTEAANAAGEFGYASNAFSWFANSEDLTATASANLWTIASGTSATVAFTPAVAFTAAATVGTNLLPDTADGAVIGSATAEWSDLYLADGGVIYFQNDQSVYLTPSAGALALTGRFSATGGVVSATPVIDDPDNFAANFTGGNLYGGTFIANAAGTAALPDPAVGMNFTYVMEGANANIIDPLATGTADTIYMNGLAAASDENITSSTSGAMCVFQYRAANTWMATCNGFAEATPP